MSTAVCGRFRFNLNKCATLRVGRDSMPNVRILMGEVEVKVQTSSKHVGVKLCCNRQSQQEAICERIGDGRRVIHAARAIGSAQVPAPPTVLSKLYWSVAVPKMLYGFEVSEGRRCFWWL